MAGFLQNYDSCPVVKNILLLDSEGKRVAVKYYSDDWPTNNAKVAFEKSIFTKTQKTNARTEDGLTRGMAVIDTRAPISVPVGGATLGRIFNVLGEPVDNLGPADTSTTSPIHRSAPALIQLDTKLSIFETGIKVVDLLAPYRRGGKIAEITMFENNIIVYKFVQDLHFFVTGGDDENELVLATVLQGFCDAVTLLLRNNVEQREALENLDLILLCLDEIVDGGMILETDGNIIAGKVSSHNMDDGAPLSEQTITQALATAREHLTRSLLR